MAIGLKTIVENLVISIPEVNSVAFLSEDGLPIVTATAEDYDDDVVMAVTSAFQQLSETVKKELKFQNLNEIIMRSVDGVILIMYVDAVEALLYIAAEPTVKLGIMIMEADRSVAKLQSELNK